jgi:two-component system sensor histidine kinase/response regulator
VGVRTEQLEKAKNAAEAASRAKSAFLATMSHEIRTPMNGVLGMTEMLLGTPLTDTQRNYTKLVKRSGEHLLVIINDILDFSKIEAGKLSIEYINFNLWDLLDDINTVYTPQAQAKGIALDFDIANDIPVAICGDPNRLRQIMANLLGNAIKFTDQGRILARVRVASEDSQAVMLRFEVHDTGIGISREARGRMFEAFSQADGFDHPQVRRHRPGPGDLEAAGRTDGRRDRRRQCLSRRAPYSGSRSVSTSAASIPTSPAASSTAIEGMRVLVVDEDRDPRVALERHLARWQLVCLRQRRLARLKRRAPALGRARRQALRRRMLDMDLTHQRPARWRRPSRPTRHRRHPHPAGQPERLAADPVQRREAGVAYQLIKPARAATCSNASARARARRSAGAAVPAAAAAGQRGAGRGACGARCCWPRTIPVNVEVATAMLEQPGPAGAARRNGAEALRGVRGEFEAVLMDCQMPVMDGFAATAEIRRHEEQSGRRASCRSSRSPPTRCRATAKPAWRPAWTIT